MTTETDIDARLARALGWCCYLERRGEYRLAITRAPGEEAPWMRSRLKQPERYEEVSCEEALRVGFYPGARQLPDHRSPETAALIEDECQRRGWCYGRGHDWNSAWGWVVPANKRQAMPFTEILEAEQCRGSDPEGNTSTALAHAFLAAVESEPEGGA